MTIDKVLLERFRDLSIAKSEMYQLIPKEVRTSPIKNPVEVCNTHLIQLLEKYQSGLINEDRMLEWVNIV